MGGYGSTRWNGVPTRHYTGECFDLDLRRLAPYLANVPTRLVWRWQSNRGQKSSVSIGFPDRDTMVLTYSVARGDGPEMAEYREISLAWTACTYGGERPWFHCPSCNRRVLVVYLPPGSRVFACRHCHVLAYTTQQCSEHDRLLMRIRAIQERLGGDPAHLAPWYAPPKPTRMRMPTYRRLVDELYACERRRDTILTAEMLRLVKRSDRVLKRRER